MANAKQAAIAATINSKTTDPSLKLEFAHGEELTLRVSDLSPEIARYALLHGLKQKLVDAAAISRNPETGQPASIDDKFKAVSLVLNRLVKEQQWNAPREGGGGGGILFRALVELYEGRRTPDEIKEFLGSKSDAEKTALRRNSKVAAIIERIRVETGKAANIDTDELLSEL